MSEKLPVTTAPLHQKIFLSWDLPAYKSDSFNDAFPDLEEVRSLPIYDAAVRGGLIKNDEWVGPPGGYCPIPQKRRTKE
jgi:hypothetical protein